VIWRLKIPNEQENTIESGKEKIEIKQLLPLKGGMKVVVKKLEKNMDKILKKNIFTKNLMTNGIGKMVEKEIRKKYRINNIEKCQKLERDWARERRKDPLFKLICNMRARTISILKKGNAIKLKVHWNY
jgi:hypothetical protein